MSAFPLTARAQLSKTLATSSPTASAQKVFNLMVNLENGARANNGTARTIIGQRCEAQGEI